LLFGKSYHPFPEIFELEEDEVEPLGVAVARGDAFVRHDLRRRVEVFHLRPIRRGLGSSDRPAPFVDVPGSLPPLVRRRVEGPGVPGFGDGSGRRARVIKGGLVCGTCREIKTGAGQRLKLFRPNDQFFMGASRREAGRRANEVLTEVKLTRAFYLGLTEVTNQQYRRYAQQHSSGHVQGNGLNGDTQPVVNLSWQEAALYCNWLSEQDGLPLAYQVEDGKVVGINSRATGYRLPTEAEWAWAARKTDRGMLKYPWGEALPPTANSGNYADRSAAFLIGRIVAEYDDRYAVTAPVGSFAANHHGLYEMGGNVAEWVQDYYATRASVSNSVRVDPVGPESGKYHVIRGASWAHGSITELRLSFRDYGDQGRNDVGFRVVRYVE